MREMVPITMPAIAPEDSVLVSDRSVAPPLLLDDEVELDVSTELLEVGPADEELDGLAGLEDDELDDLIDELTPVDEVDGLVEEELDRLVEDELTVIDELDGLKDDELDTYMEDELDGLVEDELAVDAADADDDDDAVDDCALPVDELDELDARIGRKG